jgi:hypothetical protein
MTSKRLILLVGYELEPLWKVRNFGIWVRSGAKGLF